MRQGFGGQVPDTWPSPPSAADCAGVSTTQVSKTPGDDCTQHGGQLGQQFVLEPTVPPAPVHSAADCRTSHFPFFSVQVTAEAPWPQVEVAMQLRIAELQSLAKRWPL